MSNELTITQTLNKSSVKRRFEKILGDKAQSFMSSILQVVNENSYLQKADPNTVLNAAATAAVLDLPINKNLGFAWIVPYKGRAQFQMGWKGFVQLAQRTGQYKKLNVIEVYENQYESYNRLTEELKAEFDKKGEGNVVGYVAYFELLNGFEKLDYWTKEDIEEHAKRYSQSYGRKSSPWNDNFDAMAKKTVLKNMISKWGIMSVEMQTAQLADQSIQRENDEYDYDDNTIDIEELNQEEENERFMNHVANAESADDLEMLEAYIEGKSDEAIEAFEERKKELS